jgi:hypothetical protein
VRIVAAPLLLGALAAPLYWGFTYSGPYRWLAEWQLEKLGGYRVMLTGLVTLLITLVPVGLLVMLLGARSTPQLSPEGLAAARARDELHMQWIRDRQYRLIAAGLSVGIALVGCYLAITGATAGARTFVEVSTLERGRQPPSYYVELRGRLLFEEAAAVSKRGSSATKVYVPIVSDAWRPGQPVRAYLETYDSWIERYSSDLATGRYVGVLSDLALPGVAQTTLTERGLRPTAPYWVLDYRQDPQEQTYMGLGFVGTGAVWGTLTAWVWRRLERRKRASPKAAGAA